MAEIILKASLKQSKGWNFIQVPAFFFDHFASPKTG